MKELDLRIPVDGDKVRFDVERVMIEPFDLRQDCKYDLVVDRLTHWYHTSREWIKKAILLNDLYVFNNPWSVQANEKHTTYCAMMRLGMRIPETWMIPPKTYEPNPDLKLTLSRHAKLFDVTLLGQKLGWPMFMKPYDGGGWRGVVKVDDPEAMWKAYDDSGKSVMHVQSAVHGFDRFVRCIGFGPQTHCVLYDPAEPGALAAAIERLADPGCRRSLGLAARARAERDYSWKAHCAALMDAVERQRAQPRR